MAAIRERARTIPPAVTAALSDPAELLPHRAVRWVRWALLALALVWFALGATWVVLYRMGDAALRRGVATARSRGEPLTLAEFSGTTRAVSSPLASRDGDRDGEAIDHLRRAAAAYQYANSSLTPDNWEEIRRAPLTTAARRYAYAYVSANATALAELRRLRSAAAATTTPADWHFFDGDADQRERKAVEFRATLAQGEALADLPSEAALLAECDGDHADAVERLRDAFALARTFDAAETLPAYDVACAIETSAAETAAELAHELNDPRAARPASAAQLRAMIDELLDDREVGPRGRETVLRARAASLDVAGASRYGTWDGRIQAKAELRPLSERIVQAVRTPARTRALARQVPIIGTYADAMALPDWPAAWTVLSAALPASRGLYVGSPRVFFWTYSAQPTIKGMFWTRTARRCAGVLLALRAYQLDHGFALPARLDELQGAYLDHVPADPMAPGGRAIGYARFGTTALIYSVGNNGRDDLATGWIPGADDLSNNDALDYVLPLDRREAILAKRPAVVVPSTVPATAPAATSTTTTK
jgi:hypothetical protein